MGSLFLRLKGGGEVGEQGPLEQGRMGEGGRLLPRGAKGLVLRAGYMFGGSCLPGMAHGLAGLPQVTAATMWAQEPGLPAPAPAPAPAHTLSNLAAHQDHLEGLLKSVC